MFNNELERSLDAVRRNAINQQHEFITLEHLLFELLNNSDARTALLVCGADIENLRANLHLFIDQTASVVPKTNLQDVQPTQSFQRVLQRSIFQVQSAGQQAVNGANVIAAIFSEHDSQAIHFLLQENVNQLDIINYVFHGSSSTEPDVGVNFNADNINDLNLNANPNIVMPSDTGSESSALAQFTVNLNIEASANKFDPLIGRDQELSRMIHVLSRRQKNNPLLVGEPGVGKTAVVEGLAKAIVDGKVPKYLKNATVYLLDLGLLLAGTKYRGDFEKRFKGVLEELQNKPGSMVFIDEIHTLIGAGVASGGTVDAANLLKPLLSRGKIKCIGATTHDEYRQIFEKDRALSRRFQKVDVAEPSKKQTIRILQGLSKHYEEHHNVFYNADAIHFAVELSSRYINDRFLPDKAIDVLDEAGAKVSLAKKIEEADIKVEIGKTHVEEVVASMARIPAQSVSVSDREILAKLDRNLKMMIYGQDNAIGALTASIRLSRSGLREAEKTVGSFLLAGPTGVGKTEACRQLARALGIKLLRFDMSEYMERHTASRLIGSPPGYVGFEQGGLLTEAVRKNPYSVVLLDEIEKAHQDVFNLLLQVMDHGTLTDSNGRSTSFRNVILLMTTNAGAEKLEKTKIGFVPGKSGKADSMDEIQRLFSPEFRNRLDSVIQFDFLDRASISKVVDKMLVELQVQLDEKKVKLQVNQSVKTWLAKKGFNREMGARPMQRLIQDTIKKELANELLYGKLQKGGHVTVQVKNKKIAMSFEKSIKNLLQGQ